MFAISHVTNVFYVDRWLTVTQDGEAKWQDLQRELAVPPRAAPAAADQSAAAVFAARESFEHLSESDQQRLDDINLVPYKQIRPYLQSDGGDLHVLSLVDNQLVVTTKAPAALAPVPSRARCAASRISCTRGNPIWK